MARLRLFGELATTGREQLALRWFRLLSTAQANAVARSAGLDQQTTHTIIEDRPHLTYNDLPEQLRQQLQG